MSQQKSGQPSLEENRSARYKLKCLYLGDDSARASIYARCKGDTNNIETVIQGFFFWCDHFTWAHDEFKPPAERVRPVVLWDKQRDIARVILENIFRCALLPNNEWNAYGEKGRRTAWTFLNLLIDQYIWQFHGISVVITSKTIEETDARGNMNTPFEKLRFQIERQPKWLLPDKFDPTNESTYKTNLIAIPNGGAQIAGIKPNGAGMRQARGLVWNGDEFPHTTNADELWDAACGTVKVRIIGGTPSVPTHKAYKIRFNKNGENAHVFVIDWWDIPEYAEGLTELPDGTKTSPWWEEQKRMKSKQTLAKEYLMDWDDAAGGRVFHMFRHESCIPGLELLKDRPLYRIWDPGGNWFGVVWAQADEYGTLRYYRELALNESQVTSDTLLNKIAREVLAITADEFPPNMDVIDLGDPYGSRKQLASQEKTEYELLYDNFKIRVQSAYMYAIPAHERRDRRIAIMGDRMSMTIQETGKPGLLIDPIRCPGLLEAFKTGYRYVVLPDGTVTSEIARNRPANDLVDCSGMFALKVHTSGTRSGGLKVVKKKITWKRTGRS